MGRGDGAGRWRGAMGRMRPSGSGGLDALGAVAAPFHVVIPAKAGIQRLQSHALIKPWMPAFAGMTVG